MGISVFLKLFSSTQKDSKSTFSSFVNSACLFVISVQINPVCPSDFHEFDIHSRDRYLELAY